jgi:hypothetical protein
VRYLVDTFKLTAEDARAKDNFAFRTACASGHLPVVQYLVETFKLTAEDARAKDNYVLRMACASGHTKVVEYLRTIGVKQTRPLSEILVDVKREFNISS